MLILASNSPRRKQLLALGGWSFVVLSAPVDEQVRPGEPPGDYVLRLAVAKAQAAAKAHAAHLVELPEVDALILAADTAVADWLPSQGDAQHEILGKPADAAEAERMLRRLRNKTHQVFTGLALLRVADGRSLSRVSITDVPMRNYSDQEMLDYIDSGDPFDKAGAYAIQHPRFRPVESLQGCYANVMGLPVCELGEMLTEIGILPQAEIVQACRKELGHSCRLYRRAMALGD